MLSLAEELLNKGYCNGMDNYFALPEIFDILVANKTDPVGLLDTIEKTSLLLSTKLN